MYGTVVNYRSALPDSTTWFDIYQPYLQLLGAAQLLAALEAGPQVPVVVLDLGGRWQVPPGGVVGGVVDPELLPGRDGAAGHEEDLAALLDQEQVLLERGRRQADELHPVGRICREERRE